MSKEVKPYSEFTGTKKQQVQQMFDNISYRYDFLNHLLSFGVHKSWRKKVIHTIQPYQPKRILDVATGTGELAIALLKLKPEKIIGVDISVRMLEIGRNKLGDNNAGILELVEGDSEQLLFEDNTFDAVTVAFGVRNFEDLDKSLKEMYRVLSPGGVMCILEFSRPQVFPVKQVYNFYICSVLPALGKFFSGDREAYEYLPQSVRNFSDGLLLEDNLIKTGFKSTTCRRLTFGIASIYIAEK